MTRQNNLFVLIKNLNHGGAQKVCVTICNEFIKRDYNVELWVLDFTESTLVNQLDANIRVINLNTQHVRNSGGKLVRLLQKHKPVKLLVFNIELAILTIIIKKLFFLKTEIIFRCINTLSQAYQFPVTIWERFFASIAIKKILPLCDVIIAQSNGMKEDLINHFNFNGKNIKTIFNPAVINSIGTLEEMPVKAENNFLYVGRLMPQKGLLNLIDIFSRVKNDNPDITLTIVGEGPEKKKIEETVIKSGLSSSVKFMGYQPNPYLFFKQAKATLLTSLYEGFPNVLVESITLGTPVIAYDCPSGPADIIENRVNGILVPNQNQDAFVESLNEVARNNIRFSAQKVIETSEKFSVDSIIDNYEKIMRN